MPAAQRSGDVNTQGGVVTAVRGVFINGLPAVVVGDPVAPHASHLASVTAVGSSTVFINGMRAIRTGDVDACGDVRVGGSPNVFIGG